MNNQCKAALCLVLPMYTQRPLQCERVEGHEGKHRSQRLVHPIDNVEDNSIRIFVPDDAFFHLFEWPNDETNKQT